MIKRVIALSTLSFLLLFAPISQTDVNAAATMPGDTGEQTDQNIQFNKFSNFFKECKFIWKNGKLIVEKQPQKQPEIQQNEQPSQPNIENDSNNQNVEQNNEPVDNTLNEFEREVFKLTNDERTKQGLAPLQIDYELSKVAREKSRDMAVNGYFDHNSPTYGSPFDMMRAYGISYRTAGENIAKGQRSPQEVVNAWMNSSGHRANILSADFTHIGLGYVEQGNVWTQQFIGK